MSAIAWTRQRGASADWMGVGVEVVGGGAEEEEEEEEEEEGGVVVVGAGV